MQDATFLFTDIEGSTRLWEEEPERMRVALARHDALARECVEKHGGQVVKMTGDGVHAVFETAADGLAATLALLRTMRAVSAPLELRVRCGLHAGPAEGRDGDFFGTVVNRAARVMGAAHGGQALVSEAVVQRLGPCLPPDTSLRDLGAVRLRDLARPERLFQIVHPELRDAFPALRSLESTPNNLPLQISSFVGREREIAQLRESLERHRLVTVVGLGGQGKTRLALHAAAEAMDAHGDGVWLVELAALQEDRWVAGTIAAVLGIEEQSGRTVEAALEDHLRGRELLVVLDNCEHVLQDTAALVRRLLSAAPGLRVLATSREPFGLPGEAVFPLRGLAVPGPRDALSRDAVSHYDAVRLFLERAHAADPGFDVDDENAATVAAICHRLDGIPLAIELAAARVRSMPLADVATRLKDRFRLLTSRDSTAMPRQRTLRATIDWSYALLPVEEQALFRRLSIFAGGWTSEAAEAVCGPPEDGGLLDDGIARLVDKSLVSLRASDGRYEMLETVREYGLERLAESGEVDRLRARHLEFFAGLGQQAKVGLFGERQREWLERVDRERENVLAAHAAAGALAGRTDEGLRMLNGLKLYWVCRGQLDLGLRITREAAERAGASAALRAQGHFHAGQLAYFIGDYASASQLLERSLELARGLDDPRGVLAVLQPLGMTAIARRDFATAGRCLHEALDRARANGTAIDVASGLSAVAMLHRAQSDFAAARACCEEAARLLSENGHDESRSRAVVNLGMVALEQDCVDEARAHAREAWRLACKAGSQPAQQAALDLCAALASRDGDAPLAAALVSESERRLRDSRLKRDLVDQAFVEREIARRDEAPQGAPSPDLERLVESSVAGRGAGALVTSR